MKLLHRASAGDLQQDFTGPQEDDDDVCASRTVQENYQEGIRSLLEFEDQTKSLEYTMCDRCKQVKLGMTVRIMQNQAFCSNCWTKRNFEDTTRIKQLPVWIDKDGQVKHDLPLELMDLREGEKLLIQQVSPYVPLQHLSKGSYGCKGHVCSFLQNVQEICTILPRLPSDVNTVRVIKHFTLENEEIGSHTFCIRKQRVLDALKWLKEHNVLYKDITIEESNLEWMGTTYELELPITTCIEYNEGSETEIPAHSDEIKAGVEASFGIYLDQPTNMPGGKDKQITKEIEQAVNLSPNADRINFPYVSEEPTNEYSGEMLFCKAFPWLFPGGHGDFHSYREEKLTIMEWIQNLVYYYDGRFAKDKMWIFFALNFATRHINQKSGAYFVDGFFKEGPKTLDDLKEDLKNGNTEWIDRICYYSYRVPGSAGYWRKKRNEVMTWISHHVEEGHGGPSLFITLSCAEYYWPDIIRLLKDRFKKAGLPEPDMSSCSKTTLINDFTLVIQEYFQARVKIWLETVGKDIFDIEHYWLRYEFAPGRGQIHCHLLAITKQKEMLKQYFSYGEDRDKQAEYLQTFLQNKFWHGINETQPFHSGDKQFWHRKPRNTVLWKCPTKHR